MSDVESRGRDLLRASVDGLDMRICSRLTRARHAALENSAAERRRSRGRPAARWTSAAAAGAAVVFATALWMGLPGTLLHSSSDTQPSLEDLDMVASTEEGPGDALEMFQNELDFYVFADKAAASAPAV